MTSATDDETEAARTRAAAPPKQQATGDNRTAEAARIAEAEKTARLRALRLANEKSDQIAAEVRRARRQR